MEGHVALAVLSHSARWAEVEDSHTCRDVFLAFLSLAGAPHCSSFLFKMSGQQPGPFSQVDCFDWGFD